MKKILVLLVVLSVGLWASAAKYVPVMGNPWLAEAQNGSPAVYNLRFKFKTLNEKGKYENSLYKGTLVMTTNDVCRAWVWNAKPGKEYFVIAQPIEIEPIYHICVWDPVTRLTEYKVDNGLDAPMTAIANDITRKKAQRSIVRFTVTVDGKTFTCCGSGNYKCVSGSLLVGDSANEPGGAGYGTWRMTYNAKESKWRTMYITPIIWDPIISDPIDLNPPIRWALADVEE